MNLENWQKRRYIQNCFRYIGLLLENLLPEESRHANSGEERQSSKQKVDAI